MVAEHPLHRLFRGLVALLLAFALVPVAGVASAHAASKKPISAHNVSGDYECNSKEWHFVITQIDRESNAPDSITVTWTGGKSATVTRDKFTGKTAHYTTTKHLDRTVTSATTTIYKSWNGTFNLSHGPCQKDSKPSGSVDSICDGSVAYIVVSDLASNGATSVKWRLKSGTESVNVPGNGWYRIDVPAGSTVALQYKTDGSWKDEGSTTTQANCHTPSPSGSIDSTCEQSSPVIVVSGLDADGAASIKWRLVTDASTVEVAADGTYAIGGAAGTLVSLEYSLDDGATWVPEGSTTQQADCQSPQPSGSIDSTCEQSLPVIVVSGLDADGAASIKWRLVTDASTVEVAADGTYAIGGAAGTLVSLEYSLDDGATWVPEGSTTQQADCHVPAPSGSLSSTCDGQTPYVLVSDLHGDGATTIEWQLVSGATTVEVTGNGSYAVPAPAGSTISLQYSLDDGKTWIDKGWTTAQLDCTPTTTPPPPPPSGGTPEVGVSFTQECVTTGGVDITAEVSNPKGVPVTATFHGQSVIVPANGKASVKAHVPSKARVEMLVDGTAVDAVTAIEDLCAVEVGGVKITATPTPSTTTTTAVAVKGVKLAETGVGFPMNQALAVAALLLGGGTLMLVAQKRAERGRRH